MKIREKLIAISQPTLSGNEEAYVTEALRSTWISSLGAYIDRFEKDFAAYTGVSHAVSVSNGTVAITLALRALGIGPGDEVISPSFTFASTVNAILHLGATPVLVDSLADHWNMDPAQFEKAITSRTKAVIPVHLYGHPCDMEAIIAIARKHKIFVVEDAAEAHGAEVMGKRVGALSDISCFSFFGNKIITTGEGGLCLTNDPDLNKRMRMLRDHGMDPSRRYWHLEVGYNFRMTNLNAAIGVAQVERIDEFLAKRARLAKLYEEGLAKVPGIKILRDTPQGKKIDWMFCAFVTPECGLTRDQIIAQLKKYQIDSRPTFYPVHVMPPYRDIRCVGTLLNAEKWGLGGFNLPIYPNLSESDVAYVIEGLKEIVGTKARVANVDAMA